MTRLWSDRAIALAIGPIGFGGGCAGLAAPAIHALGGGAGWVLAVAGALGVAYLAVLILSWRGG